jgi:hypothetical protein
MPMTSILLSNNCHEELQRIVADVSHNTIKCFQVNPLALSVEENKTIRFKIVQTPHCRFIFCEPLPIVTF